MTTHPTDRDWDRLDALVDEDPIALRDTAWRLATALTAAEHREEQLLLRNRNLLDASARADRLRALLGQDEQRIRDLTQEVRDERAACLDQIEQVQARDARIQAVRDMHQPIGITDYTGPRIQPGGTPIPDDHQVCDYCTDPDGLGWTDWPCDTIRALDGEQ